MPKVIDIRLAEKLDFGASQIGLIVSFIYIVSGLMNYIGGILADKYPEKNIYLIGILGQILRFSGIFWGALVAVGSHKPGLNWTRFMFLLS